MNKRNEGNKQKRESEVDYDNSTSHGLSMFSR